MREPRRAVNCDEVDAHSRFRHFLVWRPGERAAVKRRTNRRERRERKADVAQRVHEECAGPVQAGDLQILFVNGRAVWHRVVGEGDR